MKFKNGIAIPTTKFEKVMLQKLKYDLLDNNYVCGNWHPEECAIYHPLDLVDALGYPNATHNGRSGFADEYGNDINQKPTNLDAIIAGYRLAGKHRKVTRILKECKRRKIYAPDLWGHQIPYYDYFDYEDEDID